MVTVPDPDVAEWCRCAIGEQKKQTVERIIRGFVVRAA